MSATRFTGIFRRLRTEEAGVTSIIVVLLMTVLMVSPHAVAWDEAKVGTASQPSENP